MPESDQGAAAAVSRQRVIDALRGTAAPIDPTRGTIVGLRAPVPSALAARLRAPARAAAVLLPLVERDGQLALVFTERAVALKHHAGQISFPGGRLEPGDHGPLEAALREAEEEIGLPPACVEVAGYLPAQLTVASGFAITPVVGLVAGSFQPRPDPSEVAGVFEAPLAQFMSRDSALLRRREFHGALIDSIEFDVAGRRIWGATASILWRLARLLEGAADDGRHR